MALTRLFVNDTLGSGIELQLGREQAHYLGRVLRLRDGDMLTVFNGDNGEFDARVVALAKNSALVSVDAPVETATDRGSQQVRRRPGAAKTPNGV